MASEFVDLVAQTQNVLPPLRGGTGNAYGMAAGVITTQYNQTGSTWPVYSALSFFPGGGAGGINPQLTTDANPGPFLGVVMGPVNPQTGTFTVGNVPNGALAAVQTSGVVPMLIDSGNNYAWYVSTGGGAAHGHVIGAIGQTTTAVGIIFAPGYVYLLSGGGNVSSIGFLSTAVMQAGDLSGVVATGNATMVMVPWAFDIVSVSLFGDQVGSAVVDIYGGPESLWPPSTSICAAALPTLSSSQHYQDTTLTGWTTSFAAHTCFRLHVNSASTVEQLTCELVLRQTG